MRKYLIRIAISIFILAALAPLRTWAAADDEIRLDEGGLVTVVSQHAAQDGVSSLMFSLSVESGNGARAEFQFEASKAKILEFRYDEAGKKLNVYVAGTEALFSEGTNALNIGRIRVLDANGSEVAAKVSVVADSLQYVYDTEVKTMQGVELPGTVQIGPSGQSAQPTQAPSPQPPTSPQTPSAQAPTSPQAPSSPQTPTSPQTPAATPAPVVFPTPAIPQISASLSTPQPAQIPGATSRPRPTAGPIGSSVDSSEAAGREPWQSGGSSSEDVPEMGEDILPLPLTPGGEGDGQLSEEDTGREINWLIVIAVVVVLVVVAVEVMAFVVLKKPHGSKRRRRRG